MEKEFCFKDLFAYYMKRWFVVAVSIILSVLIFLIAFVLKDKFKPVEIKASARFYSITDFLLDTENLGVGADNPALVSIYKEAAVGVFNAMNSDYVKSEFVKQDEFFEHMESLSAAMGSGLNRSKSQLVQSFVDCVTFKVSDKEFSVSLLGKFDSESKTTHAKAVLSLYLKIALEFAYNNEGVSQNSIVIVEPFVAADFGTEDEYNYSLDYYKSLSVGLLVGVLAGIVVVFVMFSLDNRLKSFKTQMSELGGELVGVNKGNAIDDDTVLGIVGRLGHEKTLLVASAKKDELLTVISDGIASKLASCGFKTLNINLTNCGLKLLGEEIKKEKVEFESVNGYSMLGIKEKSDVLTFISHKEQIKKLISGFDKVVITYCEEGQNALNVLKDYIDKVLYVINQTQTKFSSINSMLNSFNEGNLVLGTYIYNSL